MASTDIFTATDSELVARATNCSLISAPSNEAVVYPMGSTMPALHVAA